MTGAVFCFGETVGSILVVISHIVLVMQILKSPVSQSCKLVSCCWLAIQHHPFWCVTLSGVKILHISRPIVQLVEARGAHRLYTQPAVNCQYICGVDVGLRSEGAWIKSMLKRSDRNIINEISSSQPASWPKSLLSTEWQKLYLWDDASELHTCWVDTLVYTLHLCDNSHDWAVLWCDASSQGHY